MIKDTIAGLRSRRLPVHGIGWQAHVDVGWDTAENLAALSDLITWAHTNKLDFHVTEASGWLEEVTRPTLFAQAETYRNILEGLLEHRYDGLVTWNTWHISDAHGWRRDEYPSLFDEQYVAKPAYYSVQELLGSERDLRCDFNLDRRVSWDDFQRLTSLWLRDDLFCEPIDLDGSGIVDGGDYAIFSQYWLAQLQP